jgi:hypothetical protein
MRTFGGVVPAVDTQTAILGPGRYRTRRAGTVLSGSCDPALIRAGSHFATTADENPLSSYPASLMRCEENDYVGHVLRGADSSERNAGQDLSFQFRGDPSGLHRAEPKDVRFPKRASRNFAMRRWPASRRVVSLRDVRLRAFCRLLGTADHHRRDHFEPGRNSRAVLWPSGWDLNEVRQTC